ncbi:hypothetical protein BH11ACT2_BH11ACT2_03230 [soil metagenome]
MSPESPAEPGSTRAFADNAGTAVRKMSAVWQQRAISHVPRPADAPRGRAAGHDSDRVLLFGTGPAVGWGVTSHELALPGALARAVSTRTRRGCEVDLAAREGMTAKSAPRALRGVALYRYDVIVIVLGVNDALERTPVHAWRDGVSELLSIFLGSSAIDASIVLVGIPPISSIPSLDTDWGAEAQQRALVLNEETTALSAIHERTSFVSLPASFDPDQRPDQHRTPRAYEGWAEVLAEHVAPLLDAQYSLDGDRRNNPRPAQVASSELLAAQERALQEMLLSGPEAEDVVQQILSLAERAFHVQSARVSIHGADDDGWFTSRTRGSLTQLPESDSFDGLAIQGTGPMVVRDTLLDERFRDDPLVIGEPHIRFYAAFPIETPSGNRVGALRVTDSQPRRRNDDIDLVFLHELALMAQQELWRHIPKHNLD